MSDGTDPMTPQQILKAAEWLAGEIRLAERQGAHGVHLPIRTARRLVDAMLETINQQPL